MRRRVLAIASALFRNWMRSRSGVFFSFLFPVMLLLLFASIFGGQGSSSIPVYVQNLDVDDQGAPTNLSTTFLRILNETAFAVKRVPPEVDGLAFVKDDLGLLGGTFRLLIIPDEFEHKLLNGSLRARLSISLETAQSFLEDAGGTLLPEQKAGIEEGIRQLEGAMVHFPPGEVVLRYLDENTTSSLMVQSILSNIVNTFSAGIVGVESNLHVQPEGVSRQRLKSVDYFLPAIIGAFVMTNGIIGVTTNTTEFKRRGVLRRFATTPMSRLEWVVSNVISQTTLSFMLVLVMLMIGWVIFHLTAIPNLLALVYIAVGSILFSGIGLILAGIITDVEAASAAGNAVAFPMMFVSGTFWSPEIMPAWMQTLGNYLPLTYLSNGLRSAFILKHLPSALGNLAVLAAMATVLILLGSLVTKWQER